MTMELGIGFDDVGDQPTSFLCGAVLGCGAALQHTRKIFVNRDAIQILMNELAHGMTHMDLVRKNDKTLERTEPQGLLLIAIGEPREEAVGVSEQQAIDTEVAAYGYKSVFLT